MTSELTDHYLPDFLFTRLIFDLFTTDYQKSGVKLPNMVLPGYAVINPETFTKLYGGWVDGKFQMTGQPEFHFN